MNLSPKKNENPFIFGDIRKPGESYYQKKVFKIRRHGHYQTANNPSGFKAKPEVILRRFGMKGRTTCHTTVNKDSYLAARIKHPGHACTQLVAQPFNRRLGT
jgi:hypothetical protein